MILEIEFSNKRATGKYYKAMGTYDTEKNELTILKDSVWAKNCSNNEIEKTRQDLINNGFVDKGSNTFKKNYICTTKQENGSGTPITNASQIICGTPRGVENSWVLKSDGTDLFSYLEQIGVVKKMGTSRKYVPVQNRQNGSVIADNNQINIAKTFLNGGSNKYIRQNVIFYGVPGCGKSQKIKETLTGVDDKFCKRILFHPEYTYSDFIGQLRPDTSKGQITYKFIPGPFTEILRDAYSDPDHEYFLIIEEINRGNAPAIFGDVFQLLDRSDKDDGDSKQGESEYAIYNKDILDYLNDELQKITNTTLQSIKIPRNLTIFATMNTCDQNVFTLDTAFKRRWRMCRIKNDFEKDKRLKDWRIQAGGRSFSWIDFAKDVNDAILNNCNDGSEAEDKQLGSHFVQASDVKDAERFAEKVLMYLWDDVAKYDKSQLFDTNRYKTLDGVIEAFVKGENVFSPNCTRINALYETMQQESAGEEDDNSLEHQTEGADGSQDIAAGKMTGKDEE